MSKKAVASSSSIERGASPLGCCRATPITDTDNDDEYVPIQGKAKVPPNLVHRWHNEHSIISLAKSDNYLFAGTEAGDIIIYDLDTFQETTRLIGHHGSIYCLTLTADGQFLFSGSSDSLVKVWNLKELREVYTIYSIYDIGDIFSIAWIRSKETLYIGSQNTYIQWIKLYEKESYNETQDPSGLPSYRFDKFFDSKGPGGKLAPQQNTVKTLNKQNSSVLIEMPPQNVVQYAHYGYVYAMAVATASDKEVLVTGGGDGTVKIWDVNFQTDKGPKLIHTLETEENSSCLSLATQGDSFIYCGLANGLVMMFDLDTFQTLRVDKYGKSNIMTLAVTGDCLFRAAGGYISKLDPINYLRGEWKAHDRLLLSALVVNHNGHIRLATGGNDCTVALWDLSNVAVSGTDASNLSDRGRRLPHQQQSNDKNNTIGDDASSTTLDQMIQTLSTYVSYKTVSGNLSEYINDCRRCAVFLKNLLRHFGAESQLLPVEHGGNPVVYGLFKGKKKRKDGSAAGRILFYGHYDVIIANDTDKWETDPYQLTSMDGYMYGRGVSDNKGPVVAAIFAVAQLLQDGELDNDIVFIIEGEEESGSVGFQSCINTNKDMIGHIDWVLLSNSYWLDDSTPCLNYGLRGIINGSVEIKSGKPDLHSGVHGGVFQEPAIDLVNLLSTLTDKGKVSVPGFYDHVRPLDKDEEYLYDAIVAKPGFENEKNSLMAKWRHPSLTIHKFNVSGPGNTTVIPASVTANFSLRIVPDQDIEEIKNSIRQHLSKNFEELNTPNKLNLTFTNEADHWIGDPNSAAFRILQTALKDEWGVDPLFIREGGSIPVVRFLEKAFNAKAAQLPCGQSSDGAHLDNERLRVTNFFKVSLYINYVLFPQISF